MSHNRIYSAFLAIVLLASTLMSSMAQQGTIGTRGNPVPRGESMVVDNWELSVIDFESAWIDDSELPIEYPAVGNQFALVRFQAEYVGVDVGVIGWDFVVNAVGNSAVAYDYKSDCGNVPDDEFSIPDVFPGGVVEVNYCWEVAEDDIDSLLVYFNPLASSGRFFFAVHPESSATPEVSPTP